MNNANNLRIKDLPIANQRIWFSERKLGYGWTPASRYGWLTIATLMGFQIANTAFFVILLTLANPAIVSILVIQYLFLTFAFILEMITITKLTGKPLERKKFFGKN
jgi:hypothetical protein